jgi:hypothetical protein
VIAGIAAALAALAIAGVIGCVVLRSRPAPATTTDDSPEEIGETFTGDEGVLPTSFENAIDWEEKGEGGHE